MIPDAKLTLKKGKVSGGICLVRVYVRMTYQRNEFAYALLLVNTLAAELALNYYFGSNHGYPLASLSIAETESSVYSLTFDRNRRGVICHEI